MAFAAVLQGGSSSFDQALPVSIFADDRKHGRRTLSLSSSAVSDRSGEIPVTVRDISSGGLLLEAAPGAIRVGDRITIDLFDTAPLSMNVAWASGRYFGCEFEKQVGAAVVSAALLRASPVVQTQQGHEQEPSSSLSQSRVALDPEKNFAAALIISAGLWAVILLAVHQVLQLI